MKSVQQIDSHNSMLTNREMAILSSQIDMLALQALQSLRYDSICAYFNAAEHYYLKLSALIDAKDTKKLEELRELHTRARMKIEADPRYQNRKVLSILLSITKDFYHGVRTALQKGKYYFRTSRVRQKGLDEVQYDDHNTEGADV